MMLVEFIVPSSNTAMDSVIEGQLNDQERELLYQAIILAPKPPEIVIEVGTWLGGGSTLTILNALEKNGIGHLWGIEASHDIYDQMMQNLNTHAGSVIHRFTPLFGLSVQVLPDWVAKQPKPLHVDLAFLDGGNNPMEQMEEFAFLDPLMPVGAQLFAHDARQRKGKFFVPFLSRLDNWKTEVHDFTENGLFAAQKIALEPSPASLQAARARVKAIQATPLEVVARLLPSSFKASVLRLMPKAIFSRLYHGSE